MASRTQHIPLYYYIIVLNINMKSCHCLCLLQLQNKACEGQNQFSCNSDIATKNPNLNFTPTQYFATLTMQLKLLRLNSRTYKLLCNEHRSLISIFEYLFNIFNYIAHKLILFNNPLQILVINNSQSANKRHHLQNQLQKQPSTASFYLDTVANMKGLL